jgi:signal transduction histidine kinase
MQEQTATRKMGRQESEGFIHTQSASETNTASGRLRWMETVTERTQRILNHSNRTIEAGLPDSSESLSTILHDTRNMAASINLYCDLLEEPGVLSFPFRHYAGELRLVAGASSRLLEKLETLDLATDDSTRVRTSVEGQIDRSSSFQLIPVSGRSPEPDSHSEPRLNVVAEGRTRGGQGRIVPDRVPIVSLADELNANRGLVSALIGPRISLAISIEGGNHPIAMTSDDLTRVLVNLASNAAQAMPNGGHIQIALRETANSLHLTFADNGPGIPEAALETVFTPGYTTYFTRSSGIAESDHWPAQHRGLGLPIVRSLVAATGGMVWATTHAEERGTDWEGTETGAVFRLEFPIRS